jgi:hypothetical protein
MLVNNRERRTDWIEYNAGRSDVQSDQKEWSDLWRFVCSFASSRDSQSQPEMFDTIDTWRNILIAPSVADQTHGDILYLNVTWQDVSGLCKERSS